MRRIPALLLSLLLAVAALVPLIANDRPLLLVYKGQLYAPALFDYKPQVFEREGFVLDYLEPWTQELWALWPLLRQRPHIENLTLAQLPAPPGTQLVLAGETQTHWLGTDLSGRDLLTRLLYALRHSLFTALLISLLAFTGGTLLGACMGYWGGLFDLLLGRVLELLGYFPLLFLLVVLLAFFEQGSWLILVLLFSVVELGAFAFYARAELLRLKQLPYIQAAQLLGQSDLRLLWKHALPNALQPLLVLLPFNIGANLSLLATVDYLGFGAGADTVSVGLLLRSAYEDIAGRWWLLLFPLLLLTTLLLLCNAVGQQLRGRLP